MDQKACPKCKRVDFVRQERLIQGKHAYLSFYCGSCDYTWTEQDGNEQLTKPDKLPEGRPGRSRS